METLKSKGGMMVAASQQENPVDPLAAGLCVNW